MFDLDSKLNDIKINHDVTIILNNVVTLIEEWYTENEIRNYQREIFVLKEKESNYNMKIKELEFEKDNVKKELIRIKQGAYDIREKLCIDISEVLYKSRHHNRLEIKVRELEKDNKIKEEQILLLENNLKETQENIAILENDIKSTKINVIDKIKTEDSIQIISNNNNNNNNDSIQNNSNEKELIKNDDLHSNLQNDKIDDIKISSHTLLIDFEEDIILLQIFSYLNTNEVLNAAQCNRFIFKRVDTLFGIDSKLALVEWSIKTSSNSIITTNSNNNDDDNTQNKNKNIISSIPPKGLMTSNIVSSALEAFGAGLLPGMSNSTTSGTININTSNTNSLGLLTQEMADSLSKKLTAIELKAIIAISERLKKKSILADQLIVEKEDITARLKSTEEVRDFLVDKLKNAELALKASMHEVASLKKQQSADNEVISFLDLKEQELNTQSAILIKKCERLQASYDLLSRSNTQNEKTLQIQLEEYKSKCDDIEISYKAEKKILVKEVKSLRTQLETVSLERNLYKQQITSLKQTLSIGGDNRDININIKSKHQKQGNPFN